MFDAKRRLETRFTHVLNVLRREAGAGGRGTFAERVEGAGRDELRLFDAFFETVTGALPGPEHRAIFSGALQTVERRERAA